MIPQIQIEDYSYPLPEERIARYPLEERDASKLLLYREGKVEESVFRRLPDFLPAPAMMVFNDTKVVPARLHFVRATGAQIEIFCLNPVEPEEYARAFAAVGRCRWSCVIGNVKRWKGGLLSLYNPADSPEIRAMNLRAALLSRTDRSGIVEFTWENGLPFSSVLEICGTVPIPPYLKRESEPIDAERYQTLYARSRGSVAAPTAGLHFTDAVLKKIADKGIDMERICLHVGAGTFLPLKVSNVAGHPMHREPFLVKLSLLKDLKAGCAAHRPLIAVGTTSVRTLESLYYAGAACIETGTPQEVAQWAPYTRDYPYTVEETLEALIRHLSEKGSEELAVGTRIIIVPGFRFRLTDLLLTNFHQPESTLILLVAAFVGGDWRKIYDYALSHDFRFLSYGDSSLLSRKE